MPRQTLEVQSVHRNYHVEFIDDTISQLTATIKQRDYLIVDKNVYDHYPEIAVLVDNCQHELVLSQESAKDFKALHTTIDRLLSVGFTKTDRLIAIGGGIVQDKTAFISSILFRGCEWIFFPTNLLTQCDSCIGSKTSINFGQFKNQLGSFYPPSHIFIDVNFNKTLGRREIRSGMGEMLHYFLLNSEDDILLFTKNFEAAFNDIDILELLILRSLEIKREMIIIDEFDRGPRNVFNYGHSFGHALESAIQYKVPHGICVSYGMDLANLLSCQNGYMDISERNRLREVIGLIFSHPEIPKFDLDDFFNALRHDKKNEGLDVKVILSRGVGDMFKSTLGLEGENRELIERYFVDELYLEPLLSV